jgi:orotidine-5'-phosphate decarboxylase
MSSDVTESDSRLILAVDVNTVSAAASLMQSVAGHMPAVKIGLELINAQLAGIVAKIAVELGFKVFWDVKLHDIPTTVEKAARAAIENNPGIFMLNVHASADIEGIKAAVRGVGDRAMVLGVSVLTSFDDHACQRNYHENRGAQVMNFARHIVEGGAPGIVCSAKELAALRGTQTTRQLTTVVPGTRTYTDKKHDQVNGTTAREAILSGADWLVIGREVSEAHIGAMRNDIVSMLNRDVADAFKELGLRESEVVA